MPVLDEGADSLSFVPVFSSDSLDSFFSSSSSPSTCENWNHSNSRFVSKLSKTSFRSRAAIESCARFNSHVWKDRMYRYYRKKALYFYHQTPKGIFQRDSHVTYSSETGHTTHQTQPQDLADKLSLRIIRRFWSRWIHKNSHQARDSCGNEMVDWLKQLSQDIREILVFCNSSRRPIPKKLSRKINMLLHTLIDRGWCNQSNSSDRQWKYFLPCFAPYSTTALAFLGKCFVLLWCLSCHPMIDVFVKKVLCIL